MKKALAVFILALLGCTAAHAEGTPASPPPAANPALIPTARTDDGPVYFRRHLDRIKQGPIDLLFQGDSITAGFEEHGALPWKERYGALRPADFGIPGDRIQNVLWRIENGELDGISPKLIVLMIGTNNLNEIEPRQVAAGITSLVAEIAKRCPSSHILLLGMFPRGPKAGNPYRTQITPINQILSGLDDGKQVTYLDIGDRFLQPNGDMLDDVTYDYVHPNPKGYQIWADAIQPVIDRYFPQSSK